MVLPVFPDAFIFDWDNTLVDSWDAIEVAMNHTLAHLGRPSWTRAEIKKNCTRAARVSFPEWFLDRSQEATDVYYAKFREVQMLNLKPMPGAEKLLLWLHERGIPNFVVSNKKNVFLHDEVKTIGFAKYFIAVAGSLDAPIDKPAREHVDFVLQKGGLRAHKDIWFVGDSPIDVLCAQNANCTPVLLGEESEAKRLSVQLVFPDCLALQSFLRDHPRQKQ